MSRTIAASVVSFIKLGRIKFVGGSLVMYSLGLSVALSEGVALNLPLTAMGLLFIILSQLMTHYCNDYFDYEADCANTTPTSWSGGSRILPSGQVNIETAFKASVVLGILAVVQGVYLFVSFNQSYIFVGMAAAILLLSWFYSAPPLRLHSTGFGELAAALVVGVLWPVLGYYLQTQTFSTTILLAVVPVFLLQFLMLIAIEFPDEAGDRLTNKKTFLVRFSAPVTARIYALLLLLHFLLLPVLVLLGLPAAVAWAMLLLLPLGLWQMLAMWRQQWQQAHNWNRIAFRSVFLFAATGLAEALAFLYLSMN
ncbi:MAG: prenyltransferase [Hymenobacteraceae bacterium]|nr:prenyltransferase [Hymenobacteraceae bacterium]MDX5395083.1 prenyltransferase [Hymenobacteraceae bacterium]MDX5443893.1 prenyltransferase [Hymenobacteraceae bacterium]MDX5511121.1 prenyltransferase [Hymenobacteraceae bacterium]